MREFKFRGMGINGGWHIGHLSYSPIKTHSTPDVGYYISNSKGCPWAYQVRPDTIGETTGLLDKNGKEVYEGDILKSLHFVEAIGKKHYLYHVVEWSDGLMGWFARNILSSNHDTGNGNIQLFAYVRNCPEIEIVGNIFENVELLKDDER